MATGFDIIPVTAESIGNVTADATGDELAGAILQTFKKLKGEKKMFALLNIPFNSEQYQSVVAKLGAPKAAYHFKVSLKLYGFGY